MLGKEERLCYGSKNCFTDGGFVFVEPYAAETCSSAFECS
jgi:hypothetical protein